MATPSRLTDLRLPARHGDDSGLPDMAFGLYDTVIVFDELERRGWILTSGFPEHGPVGRHLRAAGRLHSFAQRLESAPTALPPPHAATAFRRPEMALDDYCRRVEQVLDYIRAGDIFQANFTGRFLADRPEGLSVFDLYRRLLALSPAPFAACLTLPGEAGLASASPERFVRLHADGRM